MSTLDIYVSKPSSAPATDEKGLVSETRTTDSKETKHPPVAFDLADVERVMAAQLTFPNLYVLPPPPGEMTLVM
jgi:hypothetical protein